MFGGLGHLRNITRNTRLVRLRKTRRTHPTQPNWSIFVIMLGPILVFAVAILVAWLCS